MVPLKRQLLLLILSVCLSCSQGYQSNDISGSFFTPTRENGSYLCICNKITTSGGWVVTHVAKDSYYRTTGSPTTLVLSFRLHFSVSKICWYTRTFRLNEDIYIYIYIYHNCNYEHIYIHLYIYIYKYMYICVCALNYNHIPHITYFKWHVFKKMCSADSGFTSWISQTLSWKMVMSMFVWFGSNREPKCQS